MVFTDQFTKWVEVWATPDHQAKTLAPVLVQQVFMHLGLPQILHSDQWREFESKLFAELCKELDIDKTGTTPWHPQSDGQTERFNRTMANSLRKIVSYDQTDWDLYVELIAGAYRATQHGTTRYSPNMLMLGRETPLPLELAVGRPRMDNQPIPPDLDEHLNALLAHEGGSSNHSESLGDRAREAEEAVRSTT